MPHLRAQISFHVWARGSRPAGKKGQMPLLEEAYTCHDSIGMVPSQVPKMDGLWFIMENPIRMYDLGVPLF
jgi:hypothetical protein